VFGFDGVGVGLVADDPPQEISRTPAVTAAARIHMGFDYATVGERRRSDAISGDAIG
jgi:hypothetical protein